MLMIRTVRCLGMLGALTMPFGVPDAAKAQGRLDARYTISLAGVPVGAASWTVEVDSTRYAAYATGHATGLISLLVDGEGSARVRGALDNGRPVPGLFYTRSLSPSGRSEASMRFEDGVVTDVNVKEDRPATDVVPLTKADRLGVIDPLTAFLVPMAGAFDVLSQDICNRRLPVFDAFRRYDLQLSFKRMERIRIAQDYTGPAIVCGMTLQAHAGHRVDSMLVKYLSEGRTMEIWLAPLAGTRVVAPVRVSVAGMLGNLTIEATQFRSQSRANASAQNIGVRP